MVKWSCGGDGTGWHRVNKCSHMAWWRNPHARTCTTTAFLSVPVPDDDDATQQVRVVRIMNYGQPPAIDLSFSIIAMTSANNNLLIRLLATTNRSNKVSAPFITTTNLGNCFDYYYKQRPVVIGTGTDANKDNCPWRPPIRRGIVR